MLDSLDLIQYIITELNSTHFISANHCKETNLKDFKIKNAKNLLFNEKIEKNTYFKFEELLNKDLVLEKKKFSVMNSWFEPNSQRRLRFERNTKSFVVGETIDVSLFIEHYKNKKMLKQMNESGAQKQENLLLKYTGLNLKGTKTEALTIFAYLAAGAIFAYPVIKIGYWFITDYFSGK